MPSWARPAVAALLATVLGAGVGVPVATGTASAATTVTGVDVASWQHPSGAAINWPGVSASGQSFVFIKASEGTTYTNPYYAHDVSSARASGLVVGAYHFARPALPLSTATAQAKYFINATGTMRTTKTLPPVLDIESSDGLSVANRVAWVRQFLGTVRSLTGRTPMIYSYDNYLRTKLGNSTTLAAYPLWYANYTTKPPATLPGGWNTWTIWQYSSTARVPGISGDVDVNRFNGSKSALLALADGTKASPIAPGSPSNLTATLTPPDAMLTWTAPVSNGGSPIAEYIVSVDNGPPGHTPTTSYVAGPLDIGQHTVSVRAVNIVATGAAATSTFTISTKPGGSGTPPPATSTVTLGAATTVDRGANTLVTVTLRRADTQQLVPGELVTVRSQPRAGRATTVTAVTDQLGTVATFVAPKANATLTVDYQGGARLTASAASVTVSVRPKPSASLTKKKIKRNRAAYLKGRTSSLYTGERVYRERWYHGAWRTWSATKVKADGTYSFKISGGLGTYKYRVAMPATPLHVKGHSAKVTLKIVR